MGPIRCLPIRGGYSEDEARFVTAVQGRKARENTCKFRQKRFQLDYQKKIVTVKIIKHWNRSLRKAVETLS